MQYILFTLKEGVIDKFVGPVNEYEAEYASEEFEAYEKYEQMDENIFKVIHSEAYLAEKKEDWVFFLSSLFEEYDIIPEFFINDENDMLENSSFAIFEQEGDIKMNFSLSCEPVLAGLVSHLVTDYLSDVFHVEYLMYPFYYSERCEDILDGNEAVVAYNKEKITSFISQN
jgi:hypothetical protein